MNSKFVSVFTICLAACAAMSEPQSGKGIRPEGFAPPGPHVAAAGQKIEFPEVTGPHVLLASCSKMVDAALLEEVRAQIMMMLRMPIKTSWHEFDGSAADYAAKLLREANVAAVVVVKDEAGAPSLLAMPEQKMVIINPLAWCPEGTDKALSDARMRKMLQRGYCAAMGAALAPVFSAEDLDALRGGIAPAAINSVFRYGKVLGMERMTPVMPPVATNAIQRADRDGMHSKTNAPAAK